MVVRWFVLLGLTTVNKTICVRTICVLWDIFVIFAIIQIAMI